MKNKLSYSSVDLYLKCPKAWYLKYHRNLRERTVGSALFFGSACDAGINQLLLNKQNNTDINPLIDYSKLINRQKINGQKVDIPRSSIIKYSNTDFDADILTEDDTKMLQEFTSQKNLSDYHEYLIQLKREQNLTDRALKHFNYMSWVSLKQKGIMFINQYKEQVIPNIEEVLDVQKFFSLKNENEDEFLGYIDYICRYKDVPGIVIKDNKTSGSPYKESQTRESKQLHSYVGALRELNYTNEPIHIGFNVMVKKIRKKKEPKTQIQVLIDNVNEELVDLVFEEYDEANASIHQGHFQSNHPICSENNYGSPCLCQLDSSLLVDVSEFKK